MKLNYNNIQIDEELEKLLPPLSKEDYNILEQSLLKNGFEQKFGRIKVWFGSEGDTDNKSIGYIVDGHNRYRICQKHDIELNSWDFEAVFMNSKDEVIKWMYENQLARRNLSEMDKYDAVEKYSKLLNDMAKKNQSDGGKGLSNLTRINTRKEKARMAGTSDGNYYKLDQIKKSGNKEVIEKVRNKEISVDKAYRKIKNPPVKKVEITPQQQIEKFDNRMNEIENKIASLKEEREELIRRRSLLFYSLDIKCHVKYRWIKKEQSDLLSPCFWKCHIYIENNRYEESFGDYSVYHSEYPYNFMKNRKEIEGFDKEYIPEKYRDDFRMVWKQAHDEVVKLQEEEDKKIMESAKKQDELMKKIMNLIPKEEDKIILKKFYRVLANTYHPDNENTGDADMMQHVNDLKEIWRI